MKLLKLLRLSNMLSDMESEISGEDTAYLIKLGKLIFFVTMTTHVTACMWHFVHQINIPVDEDGLNGSTFEDAIQGETITWLMAYRPDEWRHLTLSSRYLMSIYWTMTTFTSVGYGDIVPTNDTELGFVTVTEVLGALVFAAILGNASSIIASHGASEAALRSRMDEINNFIRLRCIPRELAVRVRRYFERYYEKSTITDEDAIVNKLSQNLKQEVVYCVHHNVIVSSPFLDSADPSFVSEVVMALRPFVVTPGEDVMLEGTIGVEMYLLQTGTIRCFAGKNVSIAKRVMKICDGSYFGEDAMFNDSVRKYSAQGYRRSDLLSLPKDVYWDAARNFAAVNDELISVLNVRVELLTEDENNDVNRYGGEYDTAEHSHMAEEEEDNEIKESRHPGKLTNSTSFASRKGPMLEDPYYRESAGARLEMTLRNLSMVRENPELLKRAEFSVGRNRSKHGSPMEIDDMDAGDPLDKSLDAKTHKLAEVQMEKDRHSFTRSAWDYSEEQKMRHPHSINQSQIRGRYTSNRILSHASSSNTHLVGLEKQVQQLSAKLSDQDSIFDQLGRIEQMLQHVVLQHTVISNEATKKDTASEHITSDNSLNQRRNSREYQITD
mmetsp:Transcript_32444/g.44993  ORF Transcript_32444/g.44993 Transcript_32444/m.44993 type:complete len:609 (-) Transcript_32444:105-1931(-)